MSATAFLVAQPWSAHAEAVLRASVNAPIELIATRFDSATLRGAARCLDPKCQIIAPGGSNLSGSIGYFEAALELAEQVRSGKMPEPDVIVVAFGSAGTAAGLWAGLQHAGLRAKLIGVSVLHAQGRALYARRIARRLLRDHGSPSRLDLTRFSVDSRWVGEGYGLESASARTAIDVGLSLDLPLDPTYTAKAFAAALALVINDRLGAISADPWPIDSPAERNVLYWHTLGAMNARQESADHNAIPANLASLLRVPSSVTLDTPRH
jgi:D-cysteine desulfhydrase